MGGGSSSRSWQPNRVEIERTPRLLCYRGAGAIVGAFRGGERCTKRRVRSQKTATAPGNRWPASSPGCSDEFSMEQSYVFGSSACPPPLGASLAKLVMSSFSDALL